MPRVVPSQIVEVIHQLYPFTAIEAAGGQKIHFAATESSKLAGIVDLIERTPEELIVLNPKEYAHFVACVGAMRNALEVWRARGAGHELGPLSGLPDLHPLTIVRRALAKCPDDAPSPQTAELAFMRDADLRNNLRIDLSAAHRAYSNGDWKGATVLGGAVIEALLLWAVQEAERARPGVIRTAVDNLRRTGTLTGPPGYDPEKYALHELIEVGYALNRIKPETSEQCRLSKDFRNLIHPGKAVRTGMNCNRATALSALAGAEHVVRDLS